MLDDLESYEELVTFNNDIASFESDFTFQGDLLGAQVPEFFTVWSSGTFSNFEQVSVGAGEKPGNGKTPSALDPMLQALWAGQQPTIAARSNEGAKSANNHAEGPYQFFGEYVVVDVRAQDGM
ncbi:MAG: hypothetical protein MRY72_01030, partial [Aquisalinus sp.]|nr:hypothetical protein [Aquisalinus sp.]